MDPRAKGLLLLLIGLGLFAPSSYVTFLQIREYKLNKYVDSRFELKREDLIPSQETLVLGQRLVFEIEPIPNQVDEWGDARARVKVLINGKDYSVHSPISLRAHDDMGYLGWFIIGKVVDHETRQEFVAIVQLVSDDPFEPAWRTLTVDASGTVKEDRFGFDERAEPRLRTVLARGASPMELGFYSQVLVTWPSYGYPFTFPWGSGVIGLGLSGWGLALVLFHKPPPPDGQSQRPA